MKRALVLVLALSGLASLAAANPVRGGRCLLPMLGLAPGTVSSLVALPGTISFAATHPNSGVVSGSSLATVNWVIGGGSSLQTWTISVQAGTSTFSGCPTVPVSAVSAACTGASAGGGGTGTCGGAFTMSTVAQQLAAGAEGNGTQSYSVQVNYTLAESWRYVANSSCTLTLTYTVNAP